MVSTIPPPVKATKAATKAAGDAAGKAAASPAGKPPAVAEVAPSLPAAARR